MSEADAVAAAPRASNFGVAFRVLPRRQRAALEALYGFCRAVDDAVDESATEPEARELLAAWRRALDLIYRGHFRVQSGGRGASPPEGDDPGGALPPDAPLLSALAAAIERFGIDRQDLEAVIEGCAWDLEGRRYATWADLRGYCERVASAVGLAAIAIFGNREPHAREYAVNLGIALQLTNILRDIDEDSARGRIYLPAEDLAAFQVTEADLIKTEHGGRTAATLRLLHFEAQRAHDHYATARAALSATARARLPAAEVMRDVYYALLRQLERDRFPHARASLPRSTKIKLFARRILITRSIRMGARAAHLSRLVFRTA